MSLQFPQPTGPQTTSSPETASTLRSPEYSSVTARGIVQQRSNMPRQNPQMPRLAEEVSPEMPVNGDGLSLRDYVSASVGAAQATIMRQVQENLMALVPQIIRDSLRSEHNSTFENQNRTQANVNNNPNRVPPQNNNYRNYAEPPQAPPPYFPLNPLNSFNHHTPLKLEKWGIKYDGSKQTMSVEDFVFRVEALREDYQCPWGIFMKGFHHLVSGNAQQWFWDFRRQNPSCEWGHLKYHLIRKFRRYESDYEIQRKIMERRQQPSETADTYIGEIVKLQNQLRFSIPEYELVRLVKDNLKDGVTQLIFPMEISTMDQLLEECRRAERNLAKRNPYRQQPNNFRRINELTYEESSEDNSHYDIAALNNTNGPGRQLTCWNCKAPGHTFIDCTLTQRNLFCYRCGFDNVISPNCPKCKGNTSKNMLKTGPTCSSQDQIQ